MLLITSQNYCEFFGFSIPTWFSILLNRCSPSVSRLSIDDIFRSMRSRESFMDPPPFFLNCPSMLFKRSITPGSLSCPGRASSPDQSRIKTSQLFANLRTFCHKGTTITATVPRVVAIVVIVVQKSIVDDLLVVLFFELLDCVLNALSNGRLRSPTSNGNSVSNSPKNSKH